MPAVWDGLVSVDSSMSERAYRGHKFDQGARLTRRALVITLAVIIAGLIALILWAVTRG